MPFDFFLALGMFVILLLLAVSAGCFYVAWRHRWWPFKIAMCLAGIVVLCVLVGVWGGAAP